MSAPQPRNRRERRDMRRVRKNAKVRTWKRMFKGVVTPADVIANGGRHAH